MSSYIWIALGGAVGSVARFWCSGFAARHFGETFPWGTLLVNVLGSFAVGFFATLTQADGRWLVPPALRQAFIIGVCGGYTTFSSFSLETLHLAEAGEWFKAGGNVLGSVTLCLVGVWLGHAAAIGINSMKGN